MPLKRLPKSGLKASEHLLRQAFEWFDHKIANHYASRTDGGEFARLIRIMASRLFFTVLTVTDELNAFKVFETLNARGVRLSSTDLLKNYLFSIIDRAGIHVSEMNMLEHQWERIIGYLGSEQFPRFLRTHWNSRHNFVRDIELFKVVRRHIQERTQVFQLLRGMEEDAEIFAAFSQPENALWNKEQASYIAELRLLQVQQPYSLLSTAKRVLSDAEFTTILRACTIISFRYNTIGGLTPSDQERVYNAAAQALAKGELTNGRDLLRKLQTIYLSDDHFRSAFAEKTVQNHIKPQQSFSTLYSISFRETISQS